MDSLLSSLSLSDLKALLILNRTPGLRMRTLRAFFEENLPAPEILEQVLSGENPNWTNAVRQTLKVFDADKEIEQIENLGIQIIDFTSPNYPARLRESADPPILLYVKGHLLESDEAAVAIVGSRHPTFYGLEQARRFAKKLSALGLTIVSGFAKGIDRMSHEGALEINYGRTLAVLGSGIDVIYPRENQSLYEEIEERGALISEFALGTPPLAENFPKRNRIIAGLSLGVLVIEAHSRSGSLITAHLALEEGREVFALPGRVDQLGSRGTHQLIKQGAALVESPEEILETLAPQLWPLISDSVSRGDARAALTDEKDHEFLKILEKSPVTLDEMVCRAQVSVPGLLPVLTRLELQGIIRKRKDGRYERQAKIA